jgi:type I restriction enzyme, S subunit
MSKTIQIPNGWEKMNVVDVILPLENGNRPKGGVKGIQSGIPSLGGEHLNYDGNFDLTNIKFVPYDFFKKMNRGIIKPYDVLMVKDGATTGKTSFVNEQFPYDESCVNEHVFIIRTKEMLLSKMLFYFFRSNYAKNKISGKTQGTIGGINTKFVNDFPIIFPKDKQIQKQIVTKLDHILEELEIKKKQIMELMNPEKFEQLKSRNIEQLLFSAFQGNFTTQLQQKNEEPVSKLLDEIKIKKDEVLSKKGKVGVIEKVNFSIPNSWAWVTVNDITEYVTDGEHITPKRSESGILLLSARNVHNGRISLNRVDYIPESEYQRISKRLKIEIDDVLLSCSGTVGRCCVLEENLKFSLVRSVAVLRPFLKMGKFLSYAIRSPQVQTQINHKKKNTAQSNIFQNQIRSLLIPLPPLLEQKKIVSILDKRISEFSSIDKKINELVIRKKNAMTYLNHIQSSIIDSAFSGKLLN